jgi:hypothetical protein
MTLRYSSSDLAYLNRCGLFLNVIYLLDITSADGKTIVPACKEGYQLGDWISILNWPLQERPPLSEWKLWQNALAHFECKGSWRYPCKVQHIKGGGGSQIP